MVLFTGAGFSSDARDRDGRPVPSGDELRHEIWKLCFPHDQPDDSSLADLFTHAQLRHRRALARLLRRRLTVDRESLPESLRLWFALPWRRVYTLNVDDLESAVAERFGMPRPVAIVSALSRRRTDRPWASSRRTLELVHLNGVVADAPDGVAFSTIQYAHRIVGAEPWYAQLGRDAARHPFLFVGTRLDESPFWQHLEFHRRRARRRHRPRSLLVSKRLSRARASLLGAMAIDWLPMSSREFALRVIRPILAEAAR